MKTDLTGAALVAARLAEAYFPHHIRQTWAQPVSPAPAGVKGGSLFTWLAHHGSQNKAVKIAFLGATSILTAASVAAHEITAPSHALETSLAETYASTYHGPDHHAAPLPASTSGRMAAHSDGGAHHGGGHQGGNHGGHSGDGGSQPHTERNEERRPSKDEQRTQRAAPARREIMDSGATILPDHFFDAAMPAFEPDALTPDEAALLTKVIQAHPVCWSLEGLPNIADAPVASEAEQLAMTAAFILAYSDNPQEELDALGPELEMLAKRGALDTVTPLPAPV